MALYLANLNYVESLSEHAIISINVPPIVYLILAAVFGFLNGSLLPLKCRIEDSRAVLIVEFFVFVTGFTGGLLSSLYVLNPEYGQFQVVSFWLSLLSLTFLFAKNKLEYQEKINQKIEE